MKRNITSILLAVIALASIIIYAINCRPSWNPEGNKVAYIYSYEQNNNGYLGIAIHDLKNDESKSILEVSEKNEDNPSYPIEVFWSKKGDELIYVSTPQSKSGSDVEDKEPNDVTISKYNIQTQKISKICTVKIPGASTASSSCPIMLIKERWLWILGNETYYQIDIKKNKATQFKHKESPVFGNHNKLYFITESEKKGFSVGKIATRSPYKEKILFNIPKKEGEEISILATTPDKKEQFAYLKNSENKIELVILDKKGNTIKEIMLPEEIDFVNDDELHLYGQATWDPKGNILWFAIQTKNDTHIIVEANITKETTKIIDFKGTKLEGKLLPLHFALSPDQKYLAISLWSEKLISLGLIDLTSDEREITIAHPIKEKLNKLLDEKEVK